MYDGSLLAHEFLSRRIRQRRRARRIQVTLTVLLGAAVIAVACYFIITTVPAS